MPPATPQSTAATTAAASGSAANHRQGNSNSNLNPNKIDLKNPKNFNRATNSRLLSVDTDMPDPNSSTGNAAGRPSSSNGLTPMKIDGWEEDAIMARSKYLHRMEVLKRRHRRTKQLQRIYRDCYWSLMEEVKLKHREYCWKFGMSTFQEEEDKSNKDGTLGTGENNVNAVNGNTCGVHGCKAKSMALTNFCHMHILSDSKQKLYKACTYTIKRFACYSFLYVSYIYIFVFCTYLIFMNKNVFSYVCDSLLDMLILP